ncbi:MAG: prenyltransferase [Anaerolineaceae bacterium]|nr:prenyltransferase [Anaerolineaceae bacterium]
MNPPHPSNLSKMIAASRPWELLLGLMTYTAGASIHHFLGGSIDWINFWLGLGCTFLLQASGYMLKAYYDWLDPSQLYQVETTGRRVVLGMRTLLLQTVSILLTVGAVLTALLILRDALNLGALFILGLAFLLSILYAVPPTRLAYSGYGELVETFLTTALIPALAFSLQAGALHRLLAMLAFPLTSLYLAMLLVKDLREFGRNIKADKQDMLSRIGWQMGMKLHNLLILGAYLLFGIALVIGLPWNLTWPVLLSFPLGLFQVYQMIQISGGAPPRWRILQLVAVALPVISVYLLIIALWTN